MSDEVIIDLAQHGAGARAAAVFFESTTDSVLIVDWNWRISYVNGPACAQIARVAMLSA